MGELADGTVSHSRALPNTSHMVSHEWKRRARQLERYPVAGYEVHVFYHLLCHTQVVFISRLSSACVSGKSADQITGRLCTTFRRAPAPSPPDLSDRGEATHASTSQRNLISTPVRVMLGNYI